MIRRAFTSARSKVPTAGNSSCVTTESVLRRMIWSGSSILSVSHREFAFGPRGDCLKDVFLIHLYHLKKEGGRPMALGGTSTVIDETAALRPAGTNLSDEEVVDRVKNGHTDLF